MILTHINKFFHQKDACEIVTSKDKVAQIMPSNLGNSAGNDGTHKTVVFKFSRLVQSKSR